MAKSKSSIVSVHYTYQVEATVGEPVDNFCNPDSFDVEVESNKDKFSIKNMRFSLPDIQGFEIDDVFEVENTYNQTIYTMIPEISSFSTAKIAINGRPVNDAETILIDQDILVLRREILVTEPKLKVEEPTEDLNIDEELAENTNSVWKNERIESKTLYAKQFQAEIPVFDTFGNVKENDHLQAGEAFTTYIKRTNKLENIEYYKVFDNRYIRVEDAQEGLGQVTEDDEALQEILKQAESEKRNDDEIFQDDFEEGPSFKGKFRNEEVQFFYDMHGNGIEGEKPVVGEIYEFTGILHGIVDFFQISTNKFVLGTDVELISDEEAADDVEKESTLVSESTVEEEPEVTEEPVFPVADYDEEMAKTDAHAVKQAFLVAESQPVNGIVQIKGDEDESINVFTSYKKERQLSREKVKGGTFWYTNELGNDEEGDHFYKIAVDTWIPAENVKYFDK